MMPGRDGYHGRAAESLERWGVSVGDRIIMRSEAINYAGVVMPRYHHSDDAHIVLKLDSGYNIGVSLEGIREVVRDGSPPRAADPDKAAAPKEDPSLPDILLVSTGGTIASRIDYRTGAVTPALDASQLSESVPELAGIANVHPEELLSEYSENITPDHWLAMAGRIHEARSGYDGIIVAHGTDTMHYTSAFLSFALAGFPIPVVLTGSQRSSDRASSDAALNLTGAAGAIAGGIPRGVYIAMHQDQSDRAVAVHRGTRARKSHTSARGAFRTIGGEPAYTVRDGKLHANDAAGGDYYHDASYEPRIGAAQRAALIKYHPGFDPSMLDAVADSGCEAIILEGTGLGHVGRSAYEPIRRAIRKGVFVGMASQCIEGRVRMTVYESGRDLLQMGIVPLGDMIPEVALVKAVWILGTNQDIGTAMAKPVASEVSW